MRAGAALAAAALAVLVPVRAPVARAGDTQLSIVQDDRRLVLSGADARERGLDDVAALGADAIRSIVFWGKVAPEPRSRRRPAFDGRDPAAYPPALWDPYDDLVRGAARRGLTVLLSPSSPMPAWASRCGGSVALRRTCRPDAAQFERFVTALGRRYSGAHRDEDEGGTVLPRVSHWSVWNEPNQGGWLQPQYARVHGRTQPVAPSLYRALVRAAVRALRATGHAHDQILIGETAPLGRRTGSASTRPAPPGEFLRDVLCLDGHDRPLRHGARAAALGCRGRFARPAVTGVAHHPYTRGGSRPPTARPLPTEITISSASRLERLVRDAGRRGRLPRGLPVWFTEFGFQTDPPDTVFGVPLARQGAFLNESDWLAWRDPHVRSVAQYELQDEPALAAFQTGLRFADGRPKPAYDAYRLPIWVTRASGGRVRIWGQVRPAPAGVGVPVAVQAAGADGVWSTRATVQASARRGFLQAVLPAAGARAWRLQWMPSDGGATITSRVADAGG